MFTPKQWKDYPDPASLVRAADLTDLEQRVYNGAVADTTGQFSKRLLIPTEETIGDTSGAYVSLATPDTIANVPTETGDLVEISYIAIWLQSDNASAGSSARIHFDGANIVLPQRFGSSPSRLTQGDLSGTFNLNTHWLSTGPMGLSSANGGSDANPAAPQNGMVVGHWVDGGAVDHVGAHSTVIRADPGFHTVEIKFRCGFTNLIVRSRELRVRVIKYPA